jgi:geranylgeranyl diphosphate synthase type II
LGDRFFTRRICKSDKIRDQKDHIVDKHVTEFEKARHYIDQRLQEYLTIDESLLDGLKESINYSLFSGGKRIRPIFCFVVGDIFGVPAGKLTSVACALEMIHTASLIMDDLPHMDNERLRRGKPANHLVYGQDVASLASVGLLTRAYEVVLNDPELPDDKKTKVVSKLAEAVGINGMVGGQFADLKYLNASIEYPVLEYIHIHKTASLFVASGETAAIAGNASGEDIEAVRTYARNLGFAFQISDDLLDATGNESEVGKTVQCDRGNFITLFGVEKSRELMEHYTRDAVDAIQIFEGRNKSLMALSTMLLQRTS